MVGATLAASVFWLLIVLSFLDQGSSFTIGDTLGTNSAGKRTSASKIVSLVLPVYDKGPTLLASQPAKRSSGSSSSPVEPIQRLLNLGSGAASHGPSLPPRPVFDHDAPQNVTGLQDNSLYLHCLVQNLGNKSVSWIRQRDLHILSVGRYIYTTDQRYEVINSNGSSDWILKIKYAQVRDSGKYECQVSSKPVMSYIVWLHIYAPKAEIVGAPDMHVDQGSTINLTCIIEHSPEATGYIFWYHNNKVINFDSPRGGITVVTEKGNSTTGYLLIQNARATDSGNYSCKPSNTGSASLRVHVLNGEFPAAMQTSDTTSCDLSIAYLFIVLSCVQFCVR